MAPGEDGETARGMDQPAIDETAPLVRHSSTGSDFYRSRLTVYATFDNAGKPVPPETISEIDASSGLDLVRVTSVPQGIDITPGLERITSTASTSRRGLDDPERGCESPDSGYKSRYLNVTPFQFWMIFSGIQMGYVVGYFDFTLMASSHPVITSYFQASNSASWLSTAFLLTSTALLPLFGRISDTFGRRPVYLFSIIVFFLSTAWCALANSIGSFIAARAVCGLGAGGVFSMGMIICSDVVRLEYRGVYQSYINLTLGVGGCLGLVFGGYLCDTLGWRGAFAVQLPYLFIYLLIAAWTTPLDLGLKKGEPRRMTVLQLIASIDLTGALILMLGVTALIMGLNLGGNVLSWGHPLVISSLILSVILGIIFMRYERTVPMPVMPTSLLLKNPHAALIFANFFGAMGINTVTFNSPLFFQAVKLESATESGLRLVFSTLAITFSSVSTGFIITWTRRLKPTMVLGTVTLVLGGCAMAFMYPQIPDLLAMTCVALTSLGQGFAFPSFTVGILVISNQDDQAVVTTTLGLWRNLGSVMGVAISSWILQNTLLFELEQAVTEPDRERIITLVRGSVSSIVRLDPMHQRQVVEAYTKSLHATYLSAAVWAAIMLVFVLLIKVPRMGKRS